MGNLSKIVNRIISPRRFCSAIILSAGKGTRFSQTQLKQNIDIKGESVLLRSVKAFQDSEFVDEIVVVTSDKPENCSQYLKENGITKLTRVVSGGVTRSDSTSNGFNAINNCSDFVAVHDAARCLITTEMIDDTFEAAFIHGAAACSKKVVDTIKKADKNIFVESTVDREQLYAIQTPQIFKTDMLRCAIYYAQKDGIQVTDECALCEHIGFKVKLLDNGKTNIKITYPEDIVLAEAILACRERNKQP